jgi:dTDP-4-dehydrorhamnose 3,5-epimerase
MNEVATAEIKTPTCERGIGKIILKPESPDLIAGVRILPMSLWPDDRGYFLEIARLGQGLTKGFPAATTQVSAAMTIPGAIKAFHFHLHQNDVWGVVRGMFQVALVDLRPDSPTYGAKNTIHIGELRPWQILIPPRVGHGYKVIGTDPAMLVYVTDRLYDPSDEGRIAYNSPEINYDWELQHK